MTDSTDMFLQGQVLKLCQNTIETCPFTNPVAGADCIHKFCYGYPAYIGVATCPSLNEDPDNCCASDDPASCLQNYAHGSGSGSGSSSVGNTPNVCASVIEMLDSCFSATPTLSPPASALVSTSGPSATALANCLCYGSDGTYDPDTLDNYASDCAASGSAAHPTYYPLVTPLQDFCTNNAGGQASAQPSTSPSAAIASATPSVRSSTPVQASSADSIASATSSQDSTPSAETITSGGSTLSSTAATGTAAQTTSSKSGSIKISVRKSAILILSVSMLLSISL